MLLSAETLPSMTVIYRTQRTVPSEEVGSKEIEIYCSRSVRKNQNIGVK